MSNQVATFNSQLVSKAFDELNSVQEIAQFMIEYFKNFIVTRSKPHDLDFKPSIDTVNKELLFPINSFIASHKKITGREKSKINIWKEGHKKFEEQVVFEVAKLIKESNKT